MLHEGSQSSNWLWCCKRDIWSLKKIFPLPHAHLSLTHEHSLTHSFFLPYSNFRKMFTKVSSLSHVNLSPNLVLYLSLSLSLSQLNSVGFPKNLWFKTVFKHTLSFLCSKQYLCLLWYKFWALIAYVVPAPSKVFPWKPWQFLLLFGHHSLVFIFCTYS